MRHSFYLIKLCFTLGREQVTELLQIVLYYSALHTSYIVMVMVFSLVVQAGPVLILGGYFRSERRTPTRTHLKTLDKRRRVAFLTLATVTGCAHEFVKNVTSRYLFNV